MLVLAKPEARPYWIGVGFAVVGQAIRIWSAGYLSKLEKLVTAGPFALCRNPLYIGSFFITVGYCFMCNRLDVWIAGVIAFWLFHGGATAYEEILLRQEFGDAFDEYCTRIPRFLPHPRSMSGEGSFSVRQLLLNNEHVSLIGTTIVTVLFGLMVYHPEWAPLQWLW